MSGTGHTVGIGAESAQAVAAYSRVLNECGYRVRELTSATGGEAVDLLLLDVAAATRHVCDIDSLRRQQPDRFLPIALLLPHDADSEAWLDAGFDDVLRLPLEVGEVKMRLRTLLRLRARSLETERRSAARHHMIVQSAIDAVIVVDHHGRIVDFNPSAESMFMQPREGVLGQPFTLLAQPALRARYVRSFRQYVVTGRSRVPGRRIELHALRSNGEFFPAELSLTRVEGDVPTFFAFVRDLTEQRRAERDLAHLAAIVESSQEAIIGQNLDGLITSWNKGAERLFGYSAEEAIGQPIEMLHPPERAFEGAAQRLSVSTGRRHVDLDAVRLRKDGTAVDAAVRVSPILDRDGRVIGASTIAYDISARKRERIALRESEERYRSLVAATTSIVWTTDGEGSFARPQPSWELYTGQAWPAYQGWGWSQMLHPDDRAEISRRWAAAIEERTIFEEHCRLWHAASGVYRHSIMRAVPITRLEGTVRECIGTITDVHDAKQAEEALHALNQELEQRVARRTADLAQANRELEAFSYSVSHDLRAPLRAIGGFTQIMLDSYARVLDEEGLRLMQRVVTNVHRMDELVTDLLTFSRMGRVPISRRTVAPGQMVRDIVDELLTEHSGRRFDVRIGVLRPCSADASLLRQVFANLLSNAFKYTAGREVARIEVECLNEESPLEPLVYVVRDNGVGFDMRFAGKLFQVFERLHNRHDVEGTGVGLALVRRIVDRHGGRVWAEAAPDRGASFFFTLEATQPTEAASSRAQPAA